jgi:hypothetical protein
MNWKNPLELFSNMNFENIARMATIPKKNFLQSIVDNDLEGIVESLKNGVDLGVSSFWQDLYAIEPEIINKETYEFLLEINLPNIRVGNSITKDFPVNLRLLMGRGKPIDIETFNSSNIFQEILKEKIINSLISEKNSFDEDLFFIAKKYVNKEKFDRNIYKLINKFGKSDISQSSEEMHNFIISNNLFNFLLDGIEKKESLEFFLNHPNYSSYFKNCSEDKKSGLMEYALSNGQIHKVKVLHELGISLSKCDKANYSQLFMMTSSDGNATQDYVINNIDDICVGNHVILKTLLHIKNETIDHKKKIQIINRVLEQYPDDKFELIPNLLNKREDTERVLFTKKYYDHRLLKNELNTKLEPSINNESSKKLKL